MASEASIPCSTCAERPRRGVPTGLVIALAALLTAGCEPNARDPFLTPTGIRPPLENPTAKVTGVVRFDPGQFPDLANPPFPTAVVELAAAGTVIQRDTIGGASAAFSLEAVQPGTYSLTARAPGFLAATITRVTVREEAVDAGNLTVAADPGAYAVTIGIVGTIAGYDVDNYYVNLLESSALGLWQTSIPLDLPVGPVRFKFVTDPSFPDDLIGWGGDSLVVRDVPVSQAPVVFGSGPARDLKLSVTTAGAYHFQLDERRRTFSVQPATVPSAVNLRSRSPQ